MTQLCMNKVQPINSLFNVTYLTLSLTIHQSKNEQIKNRAVESVGLYLAAR